MKLEIGSGYAPAAGFDVHMDVNPACPHLEHVGPADALPEEWAGRFSEVRACDILEHFSYRDTERVLREWRRVMAPAARIYIQVPDGLRIMREGLAARLPRPAELPRDAHPDLAVNFWLLGGHGDGSRAKAGDDWRWNAHFTAFSPDLLRWQLVRAGFAVESMAPLNLNIACHARRVG